MKRPQRKRTVGVAQPLKAKKASFEDSIGGAAAERPALGAVFDHLRATHTLVLWRLDRAGRSLKYLVARAEGAGWVSAASRRE